MEFFRHGDLMCFNDPFMVIFPWILPPRTEFTLRQTPRELPPAVCRHVRTRFGEVCSPRFDRGIRG